MKLDVAAGYVFRALQRNPPDDEASPAIAREYHVRVAVHPDSVPADAGMGQFHQAMLKSKTQTLT